MIFQLVILGLIAGFLSGIFGVGGGVVFVPGILLIVGCSIQEAVGVSLAVIVPTALVAVVKHYNLSGSINIFTVLTIVCGSATGAYIGATIAHSLPTEMLKKIFAYFLILIALNMIFGWTDSIKSRY